MNTRRPAEIEPVSTASSCSQESNGSRSTHKATTSTTVKKMTISSRMRSSWLTSRWSGVCSSLNWRAFLVSWLAKLCSPTLVASTTAVPVIQRLPDSTWSPLCFSIRSDSPVKALSSTSSLPSSTSVPSTGTWSPALTTNKSPSTSSDGIDLLVLAVAADGHLGARRRAMLSSLRLASTSWTTPDDGVENHEHDGGDGAAEVADQDHADADGIEHEVDRAEHIGLDDIAVGATGGELDVIALPALTPRLDFGAGQAGHVGTRHFGWCLSKRFYALRLRPGRTRYS